MERKYRPPTNKQWRSLSPLVRLKILFIIWREIHAFFIFRPVTLSIRTGLFTFLLLTIMPMHPLSPVIACGGGLSFGLLMWRIE